MAAAIRSLSYVCPQCAELRATRRLSPVLLREQRRNNHIKANIQEETRSFRREPLITRNGNEPQGWVARLNSSSLGKTTSVLVLNSSQKHRPHRGLNSHQRSSQALEGDEDTSEESSARLLDLMSKYSKVPGQAEVNASIDAFRPTDSPTYADRLEVPRQQFEYLMDKLLRQYNQDQLSRYVTIREAEQVRDRMDEANQQNSTPKIVLEQSEWTADPDSKQSVGERLEKANVTRKRGLAKTLLRNIWRLDVAEENIQSGSLALTLPNGMAKLMMHCHPQDSFLSEVSTRRGVRIEASSGSINIYGTRPASMKAVHDIQIAAQDAVEVSFDLKPFLDDAQCALGVSNISDLEQTALRHGGTFVGSARSPSEMRILALDLENGRRCKRFLMEHLLSTNFSTPDLVNDGCVEDTTTQDQQAYPLPGRSMKANKLARGDVPILLRPEHPVLDDNVLDDIISRLDSTSPFTSFPLNRSTPVPKPDSATTDPTNTWATERSRSYRIEIGQLGIEQESQQELSGRVFTNTTPGFSQFFAKHLGDAMPITMSHMVVELVPSPWANAGVPVSTLFEFPRLQVTLNTTGQTLEVQSLKAQNEAGKEIIVRLPSTACDIKIMQRESLEMQAEASSLLLREPLQAMRSSWSDRAGLGHIQAQTASNVTSPSNRYDHFGWSNDLKVDIPLSLLPADVAAKVGDSLIPLENDAAQMSYTLFRSNMTEKVSFQYEGFNLQFESLDRAESLSPDSVLSLTMDLETSLARAQVERCQRQLLIAADKLCCELSRSIGRLKLSPAIARAYEG